MSLPNISRETLGQLKTYQDMLVKWQAKINLVSPTTIPEVWERHFVDSLQLMPLLGLNIKTLYDLGCGAGFPGLVLAIARPELAVTLVESDSKKCAFLQAVSRETGAKVEIFNDRIEAASQALPPPDVVTARALASLDILLQMVHPWAKQNENLEAVFLKGAQFEEEISTTKALGWTFSCSSTPSKTDSRAAVLSLKSIAKA